MTSNNSKSLQVFENSGMIKCISFKHIHNIVQKGEKRGGIDEQHPNRRLFYPSLLCNRDVPARA